MATIKNNIHFSSEGLSVADKTGEKFLVRAGRLYEHEQEQEELFCSSQLGFYICRWKTWVSIYRIP